MIGINVFGCALKAKPQNGEVIEPGLAAKLVFPQLLGGTTVCRAGEKACRKSIDKPVDVQLLNTAIDFLQRYNIRPFEDGYLGLCTKPFAEQLEALRPTVATVASEGGYFRYRELLIQSVDCHVYGYAVGVVFGQGAFAVGTPQFYRFKTYPAQIMLRSQERISQIPNPYLSTTKGIEHSFWSVPAHIINFNAIVRMESVYDDSIRHAYPVNDVQRHHTAGIDCACGPHYDFKKDTSDIILVHRPLDGREQNEP